MMRVYKKIYSLILGYKIQALFKITKLDADKPVVTMHRKWEEEIDFPSFLVTDRCQNQAMKWIYSIGAPQYVLHKIDGRSKGFSSDQ